MPPNRNKPAALPALAGTSHTDIIDPSWWDTSAQDVWQQLGQRQTVESADPLQNLARYRTDPIRYGQEILSVNLWKGPSANAPGQYEIVEAYGNVLKQFEEKEKYDQGMVKEEDLLFWQPGQVIKNYFRVPGGHTTGKSFAAGLMVNHFFDTCYDDGGAGAIIYLLGPKEEQVKRVMFKQIVTMRRKRPGLEGEILTTEIKRREDWFVAIVTTNDANGQGTERLQGQHNKYMLIVMDESEGVKDWAKAAVDSMASMDTAIVLMLANPHTRTSWFHKCHGKPTYQTFVMSCLNHPNIVTGKPLFPGVDRRYIEQLLSDGHAKQVGQHNPNTNTFELPWYPGIIWEPDDVFSFRVLGVAPATISPRCFFTPAVYDAATSRLISSGPYARMSTASLVPHQSSVDAGDLSIALIGIDVAGEGDDSSTIWVRHGNAVWREAEVRGEDQILLQARVQALAPRLAANGAIRCHCRVDTTGIGDGLASNLTHDLTISALFQEWLVVRVGFGNSCIQPLLYQNLSTMMMAVAAQVFEHVAVIDPPHELETDLTGRLWDWGIVNADGSLVKVIQPKRRFKKDYQHSPDNGDGCIMAVCPPETFGASYSIDFPVKQADIDASVDEGIGWLDIVGRAVAGVDVDVSVPDCTTLYVVVRAPFDGNTSRDVAIAYLYEGNVWRALAGILAQMHVGWCVINAMAERDESALTFATTIQALPAPKGMFRRTYLAQWGTTAGRMVMWKDKPMPELSQKGDETGYRYRCTINRAQALLWSLQAWRKGLLRTPAPFSCYQRCPVNDAHQPVIVLPAAQRSTAGVDDVALDAEVYHVHLARTGLRRNGSSLATHEPFAASFAVAGLLADIGIERLLGRSM